MDAVGLIGSLVACAVMAGAAAVTAWRFDVASRRNRAVDDYFWLVFGGVVVLAGAGAALISVGPAWLAAAVAAASIPAAAAWAWLRHAQRRRLAEESARGEVWADLCRRHDEVVARWVDYDVDPAKAIAFPGMHRSGDPACRPVVRALRAAGTERDAGAEQGAGGSVAAHRYEEAVMRLERAFDAAEHQVRSSGTRLSGRHRAASGRL